MSIRLRHASKHEKSVLAQHFMKNSYKMYEIFQFLRSTVHNYEHCYLTQKWKRRLLERFKVEALRANQKHSRTENNQISVQNCDFSVSSQHKNDLWMPSQSKLVVACWTHEKIQAKQPQLWDVIKAERAHLETQFKKWKIKGIAQKFSFIFQATAFESK